MFGAKKRKRDLIDSYFGKDPLQDRWLYNARDRLDLVKRYHDIDENGIADMVDEITWDDLEMDEIYLRINHTNSFIGEQILFHRLHDLKGFSEKNRIADMERKLDYLKKHADQRVDMEIQLSQIGKRRETYYLPEFLKSTGLWKIGNSLFFHIMQFLLFAFLAAALITRTDYFVLALVLTGITNLVIYLWTKQKYDAYLSSVGVYCQIYDFAKWMEGDAERSRIFITEEIRTSIRSLKKMAGAIYNLNLKKQNTATGDVLALLFDYVWGITLMDVAMFNHLMKTIQAKQQEVWRLLEFVGQTDSEIAVLSFRASMDKWCLPDITDGGIEGTGIVHPLIENPIANDFKLLDRAIITGANASGKSTFMKAVAINALLAQTIHTGLADRLSVGRMHIMTCMALRDDVLSGESYYFREAKYLKRMLDVIAQDIPLLCVIDEILKGTNTKERIAASKAILEYIGQTGCLTLVATHDNELTENEKYQKYHFESVIEDEDIHFDYRIHEGVSQESNAIALLSLLGYPEELVQQARENLL